MAFVAPAAAEPQTEQEALQEVILVAKEALQRERQGNLPSLEICPANETI